MLRKTLGECDVSWSVQVQTEGAYLGKTRQGTGGAPERSRRQSDVELSRSGDSRVHLSAKKSSKYKRFDPDVHEHGVAGDICMRSS